MSDDHDRIEDEADGTARAHAVPALPPRGRAAVAASILAAVLVGVYFAAAPGGMATATGEYLLSAAVLAVAFWIPAMRVDSAADVLRRWKPVLAWIVAWTLVWDLATSGILYHARALFQDWWLVYPAGLLVLGGLLVLHGAVLGWTARRRAATGP